MENLTAKEKKAIKRLKNVMKHLGVNGRGLSEALGYKQPQSVYHIMSGRHKLGEQFCKRLVAVYPQISLTYLMKGTGQLALDPKEIFAQHHLLQENPDIEKLDVVLYELTVIGRKLDAINLGVLQQKT